MLIFVGSGWVGRRKAVVDFGVESKVREEARGHGDAEVKGHAVESGLEGGARAHGDDEVRGGVDEAGEQSAEVRLAKSLSVTTVLAERKERRAFPFFPLSHKRGKERAADSTSQPDRTS